MSLSDQMTGCDINLNINFKKCNIVDLGNLLIYLFEIHIENAIFPRSCSRLAMFGKTVIVEAEENA